MKRRTLQYLHTLRTNVGNWGTQINTEYAIACTQGKNGIGAQGREFSCIWY